MVSNTKRRYFVGSSRSSKRFSYPPPEGGRCVYPAPPLPGAGVRPQYPPVVAGPSVLYHPLAPEASTSLPVPLGVS